MSQYDFGTIDPYVVDGVQLADMLNQWRDAVHSWHRGASRPSYVVPGMMWVNDAGGAANWIVNVYISPTVGDLPVFNYDTTSGAIALVTQAAASPSVRWRATGNPTDMKNWRATVMPSGALRFSQYADSGGELAWFEFPAGGVGAQPIMRMYSETVLASALVEIRVNVPAGAKAIELWFSTSNTGSVTDTLLLQALNGAAVQSPNSYTTQYFFGQGAAPGASVVSPSTSWQFAGGVARANGVFRPIWDGSLLFGSISGYAAGGATNFALASSYAASGLVLPTGYRLINVAATTFVVGSYLRCLAVY